MLGSSLPQPAAACLWREPPDSDGAGALPADPFPVFYPFPDEQGHAMPSSDWHSSGLPHSYSYQFHPQAYDVYMPSDCSSPSAASSSTSSPSSLPPHPPPLPHPSPSSLPPHPPPLPHPSPSSFLHRSPHPPLPLPNMPPAPMTSSPLSPVYGPRFLQVPSASPQAPPPVQIPPGYSNNVRMSNSSSSSETKNKLVCMICGDRASGKHYGVASCEGCKGFFKRTVRKELLYACRHGRVCVVDKRQRNRCQACRFAKCQAMGMRREAVQEERVSDRPRQSSLPLPKGPSSSDSPPSLTSSAPLRPLLPEYPSGLPGTLPAATSPPSTLPVAPQAIAIKQEQPTDILLSRLCEWSLGILGIGYLSLEDRAKLLQHNWRELLLVESSQHSSRDCLVLCPGVVAIPRTAAISHGDGDLFDETASLVIARLQEESLDSVELDALRRFLLFEPEVPGLDQPDAVSRLREGVYSSLSEYCSSPSSSRPSSPCRSGRLLLLLPNIRIVAARSSQAASLLLPPPPPIKQIAEYLRMLLHSYSTTA